MKHKFYIATKQGSNLVKLEKKVYICRSAYKKKTGIIVGWTKRGWIKLNVDSKIRLIHHSNLIYA